MAKFKPNISRLYPQRQTPRPSVYDLTNQQRRRGPSKDGDLVNLLAKGTTLGYSLPTATTEAALETYIKGLKDAGIWTKLDVLYVFATDGDSDFATLNLKDPNSFQCTKVNSPTFTSLEGFNGNGTSSYLNTNWSPSTDGVNYTLNSASMGVYTRTTFSASSNILLGTRVTATGQTYIFDAIEYKVNSTIAGAVSNAGSGVYLMNRNTSNNMNYYLNNTIEADNIVSTAVPPNDLTILALNQSGTPQLFSSDQISLAFAGADLTTEASDFVTLTEAYMDALGKGVVA